MLDTLHGVLQLLRLFRLTKMTNGLKILSRNVWGLGSPRKRSLVFFFLKKYKPHICCLQETNLTTHKHLALKKAWIAHSFHAYHTSYSRGVSTLLAKSLPAEILHVKTDPEGRFVLLSIQIGCSILNLVNPYIPSATLFC